MPRTGTFWIDNPGNPVTQYIVFDSTDSGYSPASAASPRSSSSCTRRTGTAWCSRTTTCTSSAAASQPQTTRPEAMVGCR